MKIGIISDIHDNILNLRKAIKILNQQKVKRVYFCGDLVSAFVLKELQVIKVPIKAVFGNNEGYLWGIARRLKKYNLDIEYEEKQGMFWQEKIEKFNIAVFHGHIYPLTESLIKDNHYDLLLTGHTHHYHIKNLENKIWINPGAIGGFAEDLENIPTFAIFDTETKKARIIKL